MCRPQVGVELDGALQHGHGLFKLACVAQSIAQIVVARCRVRIGVEGAAIQRDRFIVIANAYPIHEVDVDDPSRFLLSPGLVEYAREQGWYDPEREGTFNFTVAYSQPRNRMNPRNYRRQWRGISMLASRIVMQTTAVTSC